MSGTDRESGIRDATFQIKAPFIQIKAMVPIIGKAISMGDLP